jgi:uncharacterized protein (TIGR03437 family)
MVTSMRIIGLLVVPIAAWCQTPAISSLVNSASYQPTLEYPGFIVTIFGMNLATTTASAQSVPLPLKLGGTSVTVGGVAAPLFYVSPTQINLQMPAQGSGAASTSIVVSTSAGSSTPYDPYTATPNAWLAGGIFTTDASGCGQGAVLNVAADGSLSVNSSANSASPGASIAVYGTGIAQIINPPIGVPAPLSPLLGALSDPGLAFDFVASPGNAASSVWAGLAPGSVGLDQANVQIPTTVREGCAVPLQAAYSTDSEGISPPVTIAIRQGGGQCVDPPAAGYGQIVWQKTVNTTAQSVVSETDTMTALLQASPGQQAPPAPVYSDGCPGNVCNETLPSSMTLFGPACPVPGYRGLTAGTVTIQGPGLSPAHVPVVPYQKGQLSGLSAYQATLPTGTVRSGDFTVTASGGAEVGPFQAALKIGADIQIQTPLAGLDVFSNCAPLTINWTGGDPKSWVTVSFVQQVASAYGGYQFVNFAYQTHTSNGTMTIPVPVPPANACGPPPNPIALTIEVDPDPSEITIFPASGLSLGGEATWKYLHTFQAGLDIH